MCYIVRGNGTCLRRGFIVGEIDELEIRYGSAAWRKAVID